jgi:hypothetical protein
VLFFLDVATDPEFRGHGLFRQTATPLLNALRLEADGLFGFANAASSPCWNRMKAKTLGVFAPLWRLHQGLRSLRLASRCYAANLEDLSSVVQDADFLIRDESIEYLRWRFSRPGAGRFPVLLVDLPQGRAGAVVQVHTKFGLRVAEIYHLRLPNWDPAALREAGASIAGYTRVIAVRMRVTQPSTAFERLSAAGFSPNPARREGCDIIAYLGKAGPVALDDRRDALLLDRADADW